uniref:SKI3 subunit of superkiller complex n=1 Tax=Myripristis murdjan TaxID=586833 RepID=A0A667YAC5_9TELE
MSNKEVKTALKSAREAIKNKEFKEALKHCKAVLKLEKNNYNAWVFIGLAASELEQPDQAQTAYRKALELEPEQLLAWQGLANLYEKTDQWDFKTELPDVYQKLIELYSSSDKNKCYEVIKKVSDIYQSDKEYLKLAKVWLRLIQLKEEDASEKTELLQLWQQMTRLLSDCMDMEEPDNETQQHLITAFEKAMALTDPVPGEEHRKLSADYVKCLSKLSHEEAKMKEACESMLSLYPTQSYPLEILCSHYIKTGKTLFFSLIKPIVTVSSLSPNCGEYFFLLGRLYWDMGEETRRDRSKAHTHLLKAAKQDPNLGCVFRYLGHYYREVAKDRGRARGCYKKAFELDSSDAESGAASVDLSMEQEDMDTALTILQSVIDKATPGSAKWAWMRRGLYHLKVGHPISFQGFLQAALRADPEDWVCWECLGEAYLNRRSFTAALKAFGKAHQLQPTSIYSVYQAAAIKQTLGKFKEAAAEYLQITTREDYVPALKGLGECLLSLAKGLMEDYRDGGAIDLLQQAIKNLFRAVELRPDLSCLWKLLGDSCTTVGIVSPNRALVLVPGPLAGLDPITQSHTLNQAQTLKVGERCYGRALKLMPEAPSLWYDLGLNYHRQANLPCPAEGDQSSLVQLLEKAQQCVKKAIMMDSGNHNYWNALGVIAMSKGLENFALAQHCFIKSIQVEANNVVAWTNLGALYLKKENIELSHEAFKIAQSLEPLYVNCWIGQALIAETVGSYDTMDLFRHTTELSTHVEGVKGYAYWVCATLLDKSNRDSELYRYNIVQMNAVSAAQVALTKYTERIQSDPDAFIMLGYLNEHLQLKMQAVQAYQRCVAVELLQSMSSTEELAFALGSYGRALCTSGRWEEAVQCYSSTPLQELCDLAGLALAYFRSGLIPESISAYERALAVASTEKEKAYILTALALLQHKQGNLDSAKTLLFKCSVLKEPIPGSLLCLCALGLVHRDATLAGAALTELLKQGAATGSAVEQRCLLTCTLLALQGNYSAVQREAARAVHSNPGNPSLWALLSRLVPQYCPKKANVSLNTHIDAYDPAAWAGLMAACHTENTSGFLSGSAPLRQGLEQTLMSVVSEKGQDCVCFYVCFTVVSILSICACNCLPSVSQCLCSFYPHYLTVPPCQTFCFPSLLLSLSSSPIVSPFPLTPPLSIPQWLAEVYRSQGLLVQAVTAYRQSLQLASQLGMHSSQVAILLRLALLALGSCMAGVPGNDWKDLVLEATTEVLKLGSSPMALLFQALLQFATKMTARETRRLLERLVSVPSGDVPVTVMQVASWYLLRHLHAKNDQELMDVSMQSVHTHTETIFTHTNHFFVELAVVRPLFSYRTKRFELVS